MMNILVRLLAPLLCLSLAGPALAEKLPLAEISRYLNSIGSAQATFTQTNADGSQSTGTISIKRPGRARFEYDPPNDVLVLAGSGQVAIFDGKSNQGPESYPLRRTPLNLILAQRVDLEQARMVIGHTEVDGTTRITAQDPQNPEYGTIELVFSANPVSLRAWVITDEAGSRTVVELGPLQAVDDLPGRLFDIRAETGRRG
jgi:outer membrane lipoprotein-sorting protein